MVSFQPVSMIPHSQLQIADAILADWHSDSFDGSKKMLRPAAVCFNKQKRVAEHQKGSNIIKHDQKGWLWTWSIYSTWRYLINISIFHVALRLSTFRMNSLGGLMAVPWDPSAGGSFIVLLMVVHAAFGVALGLSFWGPLRCWQRG